VITTFALAVTCNATAVAMQITNVTKKTNWITKGENK
jgi:hypothetical protein